jgi:hypothetical protein
MNEQQCHAGVWILRGANSNAVRVIFQGSAVNRKWLHQAQRALQRPEFKARSELSPRLFTENQFEFWRIYICKTLRGGSRHQEIDDRAERPQQRQARINQNRDQSGRLARAAPIEVREGVEMRFCQLG